MFTTRLVIKGWVGGEEQGDVNKGLEKLAWDVSKGRALLDDLCVEGLKAIDGPCDVDETAPKRVALRPRSPRAPKAGRTVPQPEPEPEPEPEPVAGEEERDPAEGDDGGSGVAPGTRDEAEQLLRGVSLQERLQQVQDSHDARQRDVQATDQDFHTIAVRALPASCSRIIRLLAFRGCR